MPTHLRRLFAAPLFVFAVLSIHAAEPATDLHGDPLPQGAVARLGTSRLHHQAQAIAFAPDGKSFATAGSDLMIRLWSVADGKELRALKGHTSTVAAVAYSADGKKLYSGGADGVIREWDAAEGKELRTFNANAMQRFFFTGMVVHPTDTLLLTVDTAGIREWDIKEGKEVRSVAVQRNLFPTLCPDGKHFAVFKENMVTLRDLDDKEVQRFAIGGVNRLVQRMAFSADGSTLAAVCSDLAVVVWDVKTGRELRTLPSAGSNIALALSPNGRYVATKLASNAVRVLGVASGVELRQFDVSNLYGGILAFAPDNKHLVCCQGNNIHLWNLDTSRPVHDFAGHGGNINGVRFSPDGKRITSLSSEGTVIWWDAATGKPVTNWTGTAAFGSRLTPDGRSFYHATFNGLMRYELSDGKIVEHPVLREMNFTTPCLAITPDGKLLAVRARDQTIHFHTADGAKDLGHLTPEVSRYSYYAYSPDGKRLAGGGGNILHVFDVPSGNSEQQLDLRGVNPGGVAANLTGLEYSPDGKSLLTVTFQGAALWEAAVGRERWRLPPQTGALYVAAFSADGRLAAVGSGTGSVFVLDTATGEQLAALTGHRAAVRAMDFSADGSRLVSGSDDGTLLVWDTTELSKKVRPAPVKLTDEKLAELWRELGNVDSAKAHKAVRALAASPQSAAYIQANAKGGDKFDETKAKKLVVQLDDEEFDVREKAEKDLEGMGAAVVPLLQEVLKSKPSVEVKTRIERLLEPFKDQQVSTSQLRGLRAVEVLELTGGDDALKALKALAAGDAKDALTLEAKAALERLERRAVKP